MKRVRMHAMRFIKVLFCLRQRQVRQEICDKYSSNLTCSIWLMLVVHLPRILISDFDPITKAGS
jgi:hypothetical protein